jgi:hypothetical protein
MFALFCALFSAVLVVIVVFLVPNKMHGNIDVSSLKIVAGIKSEAFNNSIVFSLTVSIFLLSDYFIEAILSKKPNWTFLSLFNITYVILFFAVDLVLFFHAVSVDNFILVICCMHFRFILSLCVGNVSLALFGGKIWHEFLAYGSIVLVTTGLMLKAFFLFFPYWSHGSLSVLCKVCIWGAGFTHITICYLWSRFILNVSKSSGLKLEHYCGSLYAFGWFLFGLFSLIKSLVYFLTGLEDYNEAWLLSYMYCLSVLMMLTLLFQKQITRRDLAVAKVIYYVSLVFLL